MDRPESIQLHVALPYKQQPRDHPRIRRLLDDGYLIAQFQRITDREAIITLHRPGPAS
ncbi:MAG: hypothetical protein R3344_06045 [Acidobacteriota bacterium]|nr:hypothetical protein [Acidobacteriota bacterium]